MNFILLLFVILASMFVSSSVNNIIAVSGGLDYYFEKAGIPNYFAVTIEKSSPEKVTNSLDEIKEIQSFEVEHIIYLNSGNVIYSGTEIVDIIAYGVQGKDYEIVNGKSNVENGILFIFLGNLYHSLPSMSDKLNKAEIIEEVIENSKPNPFTGFYFDSTNVMSQIADTDAILSELDKLYTPDEENVEPISDFDAFIADLRTRCEAAGVYDIVDEANCQLDEWKGNG